MRKTKWFQRMSLLCILIAGTGLLFARIAVVHTNAHALSPKIQHLSQTKQNSSAIVPVQDIQPSWWQDAPCDKTNYTNSPQNPTHIAPRLLASWEGIEACGPLPRQSDSPTVDPVVHFNPDPNKAAEQEFECQELVERYELLVNGLAPIGGTNGSQVVSRYANAYPKVVKAVQNDSGVFPSVGDVLSYGNPDTENGHTSIVIDLTVTDPVQGNGSLKVLEQNGSSSGINTHQITHWHVDGVTNDVHPVTSWLTTLRHWKIKANPTVHGNSRLYSITGQSTRDMWAVGAGTAYSGFGGVTLHSDGTGWKNVPLPISPYVSELLGVSADSSSDVWAVGDSPLSSYDQTPIALHLNQDGKSWSDTSPQGVGAFSAFSAVTALSASDVWAVGVSRVIYNGYGTALIEHWDGISWSIIPYPALNNVVDSSLFSISATATNDVWAVGQSSPAESSPRPLALHWDGFFWHVVTVPDSDNQQMYLTSVKAISTTNVWAVAPNKLMHFNGKKWQQFSYPDPSVVPPGSNYIPVLQAVTASSSKNVWVTGYYSPYGNSIHLALTLHWNGSYWTVVQCLSHPDINGNSDGSYNNTLNSAFATSSAAVVVGNFEPYESSASTALIEQYS